MQILSHPAVSAMGINMPGYRIYEYQLVLVPHEALRNRIRDLRQELSSAYGMETQSKGRRSILLCSFTQYELMEEKIRTRLKTLAMGATPFKVELQGFGSFPTHSILINVASRL